MKSQTVVACGIKFYDLLQSHFDKSIDFNCMDTQFCSHVCHCGGGKPPQRQMEKSSLAT